MIMVSLSGYLTINIGGRTYAIWVEILAHALHFKACNPHHTALAFSDKVVVEHGVQRCYITQPTLHWQWLLTP